MNMVPTIGRRVWYWPLDSERTFPGAQPFDAGVAYVHSPGVLTISVHNDLGNPMPGLQGVRQTTPEEGERGCWSWMPFQVGQAKQAADVGSTSES
jgi:hypothetical protein